MKILENIFQLAQDTEGAGNSRLAACIVYKNKIISYGFNQKKTHPFQSQYSKNEDAIYLHSETDAIKNALKRVDPEILEKSTLCVVRAKRNSDNHKEWIFGLAKPCCGCAKAIATFGIKNVIYTTDEGDYKYM